MFPVSVCVNKGYDGLIRPKFTSSKLLQRFYSILTLLDVAFLVIEKNRNVISIKGAVTCWNLLENRNTIL